MLFFNVQAVFTFKQVKTLCTDMYHFESTVRTFVGNGKVRYVAGMVKYLKSYFIS